MTITNHAVDQYIERHWGIPSKMVGDNAREVIKRKLEEVVFNPDTVYHADKHNCPVHIKEDVAIPVDSGVAKTTYEAEVFRDKINEKVRDTDVPRRA